VRENIGKEHKYLQPIARHERVRLKGLVIGRGKGGKYEYKYLYTVLVWKLPNLKQELIPPLLVAIVDQEVPY